MNDAKASEPLTYEEAIGFIEAWKLMFANKVGFKHLVADLERLQDYIERLTAENEMLKEGTSSVLER